MQARLLLGPAGSGKTFRCLSEIRAELIASPEGSPLILLAPKQATFQLERQLLADSSIQGYTRLHILSFERLAQFVLDALGVVPPDSLGEEGRVMVLRALLIQRQGDLKIFRASARLTGFAGELSLLLRELQRHQLSADRLDQLADRSVVSAVLRDKLHDLALLLHAYGEWLQQHRLQDANNLLDVAVNALRGWKRMENRQLQFAGLWLDGFAEMTPQELDLLAAFVPFCEQATLAFCLDLESARDSSWLSPWSVVGQTFSKCRARLTSLPRVKVVEEILKRNPAKSRFAGNSSLRQLEHSWTEMHLSGASTKPAEDNSIRLVACADQEAEAVFAAREILRFVRAGHRFRDCAVTVRSLDPYHATLSRVFRRYGIPFFLDRRESGSHHPLAELTCFAVRTVAFGWRHADWFGALKSGFAPVAEEEIDWLENAALEFGWQGSTWRQPLNQSMSASPAERTERLRQSLVPPFAELAQQTAGSCSGPQLAKALRRIWGQLEVENVLRHWTTAARSEVHSTIWEQMNDWLENLSLAFSREGLSLRDWLPILEAGLANLTVGVIPPALDQVLIGAIDRSRNPDLKLALVLGLNEGVFPAPPAPGTLLTDADRAALEREDVYLGPTTLQRLGHERYYGYIACTRASERLVLSYATCGADGQKLNPSQLFDHAKQITGVIEEQFKAPADWWDSEHLCELAAPVLRAQTDAQKHLPENESLLHLARLPQFEPMVRSWQQLNFTIAASRLSAPVADTLYGSELKTSVSALEDFAACPFKYFAARGLRLEERKEFEFDVRDQGSFQHEVLHTFHNRVRDSGRLWRHLGTVEARVIVAQIAGDLLGQFEHGKFQTDGAARFMGELLTERLGDLVQALIEWMTQYEFDPALAELGFGLDEHGLPPWRIELSEGRRLCLRGRIDRVDLFRADDDTALAVVLDYKSSVRSLNATKLHHGLDLQLLSYLGVLHHLANPETHFGAKKLLPVGVFYVPLNGGAVRVGSTRSEVVTADAAERRTTYQHSGRFLAEALEHLDNRNLSKGDQFKYARKQGGNLAARGNDAVPRVEFDALREKIADHVRHYGQQIFAGELAVSPFRIGQQTACERCDFRAVCRFDPWTQPYRNLRPPAKAARKTGTAKPR